MRIENELNTSGTHFKVAWRLSLPLDLYMNYLTGPH